MLLAESDVWYASTDESLEQRPVEIIAFTLFDRQGVVVDFGAKLLMVANQYQLLCTWCHRCEHVAFEDFTSFFHEDDSGCGTTNLFSVLRSSCGCACDDALALNDR